MIQAYLVHVYHRLIEAHDAFLYFIEALDAFLYGVIHSLFNVDEVGR